MADDPTLAQTTLLARATPRWLMVTLLAALAMLGPFSIDTYMPSFPAMADSLNASALQVQQTLSAYLFAFAFMMLFHGALSDAFGRRIVILISLFAFVLGSIGCALSYNIQTLWVFRAVQGAAAGAGMVVGRAIIRDLFQAEQAQRMMSYVTLVFGLAPAIAPIIGGWLQIGFGWHSIFIFLAIIGVALLWATHAYLPESLSRAQRLPFSIAALSRSYRAVSTSKPFLLLGLAVSLNFAGFFLYIASAPVFVMQHLALSEAEFAWLFVPGILGIMVGATVSGRIAGKLNPRQSIRLGYFVMGAAATLNFFYNLLFPLSVPWAVIPIMIYSAGMSIAMPSISLLVIDLFPATRGLAASLQAFLSSVLNAVVAGVVSPLLSFAPLALATGLAVLLAAGFASWSVYCSKPRTQPKPSNA